MTTPGIDIRPLRELTGVAMFNEVFLTDVFVPDDCVVGEPTAGWECARTTLANERVSMASGSSFGPGVAALFDLAGRRGLFGDPLVLDRLGGLAVDAHAIAMLGVRITLRALAGGQPGPEVSVRKLLGVASRAGRAGGRASICSVPIRATVDGEGAPLDRRLPRQPGPVHRRRDQRDPAERHRRAPARSPQGPVTPRSVFDRPLIAFWIGTRSFTSDRSALP